jgi:hypothetical protein
MAVPSQLYGRSAHVSSPVDSQWTKIPSGLVARVDMVTSFILPLALSSFCVQTSQVMTTIRFTMSPTDRVMIQSNRPAKWCDRARWPWIIIGAKCRTSLVPYRYGHDSMSVPHVNGHAVASRWLSLLRTCKTFIGRCSCGYQGSK